MSAAVTSAPGSETPAEWWAAVVRPLGDGYGPFDPTSSRWVSAADLLGDGPSGLAALHAHVRDTEGAPADTAATYLAGWFAGYTAEMVGLGLAAARAGLLVERDRLRWHLHADGWPERMELGDVRVAVDADHPWASLPGAVVVGSTDEVAARAVGALVDAVAPIVDACHALARTGKVGLWNEVGDGLVMVLRHQNDRLAVDQAMIDVVTRAAHVDGTPWRSHARLRLVETEWGAACVGRKGGCCLAYRLPDEAFDAHESDDPDVAEFRRTFPLEPTGRRYCGTCSLRDTDSAEARQLFWFERSRRAAASAAGGAEPA